VLDLESPESFCAARTACRHFQRCLPFSGKVLAQWSEHCRWFGDTPPHSRLLAELLDGCCEKEALNEACLNALGNTRLHTHAFHCIVAFPRIQTYVSYCSSLDTHQSLWKDGYTHVWLFGNSVGFKRILQCVSATQKSPLHLRFGVGSLLASCVWWTVLQRVTTVKYVMDRMREPKPKKIGVKREQLAVEMG
jgi:hypothetical protein